MAGSIGALIADFQPYAHALVDAAGAAGLQPRVTSTLRTRAEQTRLYNRYLAGQSQFPAAPPGRSAHEYGYALDMVISPLDEIDAVGAWWIEQGGVWHSSDRVHFEYPGFDWHDFYSPLSPLESAVASIATPLPVAIGVTLAQWVRDHPQVQPLVNEMLAYGLPLTDLWNVELDLLPKWLKDIMSF